jgi:DNA-directed RNA polymerase specialized sigma24 family protein
VVKQPKTEEKPEPNVSLAFYRKHTERMLRRYLYASMQVGRSPSILGDPVARGWVSSRPVKTFEDAVIFVLDIEKCLDKLDSLERQMLSRIVLQEYTQSETAQMLGMSLRAVSYKFPLALDRLTEMLLETEILVIPQ